MDSIMLATANSNLCGDLTKEKLMEAINFIRISRRSAPLPLRIITNPLLTEQFQTFIPKSKRKRIIKKCRKKYTIVRPARAGYLLKDQSMFVCHPAILDDTIEALEKGELVVTKEQA